VWEPGPGEGWSASWGGATRALTVVVLAVLAAAALLAPPDVHAQPGVLDGVRNQYAAMTRQWIGPMSAIGRRLFVMLAGIEFTVSSFLWLGRSEDLTEVARRFLLKFILVSFLLMLLTSASYWLPPIVTASSSPRSGGAYCRCPRGRPASSTSGWCSRSTTWAT
jgi:hypothetical protein